MNRFEEARRSIQGITPDALEQRVQELIKERDWQFYQLGLSVYQSAINEPGSPFSEAAQELALTQVALYQAKEALAMEHGLLQLECPSCHQVVSSEDRFCGSCGQSLKRGPMAPADRYCGYCGTGNQADSRFCIACSHWL